MEILLKVLQLILSLSILIFVHELGHYLTARMFGIRVEKFYLFFDAGGFSLFKFKIGETTFGMGWVPFGGYCKISGMIDESMDTEAMKKPAEPWEFRSKPAWQRLMVMVGGVVMNVITAFIIFTGMIWHWGDNYINNSDVRWGYAFNELGHEIGFEDGDRILSVDGAGVGDFTDIYRSIILNERATVRVERGGSELDIEVTEDYKAALLNTKGFMMPRIPFVVAEIPKETSTELLAGDSLVAMNGAGMTFFDQYGKALDEAAGSTVEITVMRDSAGVKVPRVLSLPVSREGQLGIYIKAGMVQGKGGRIYSDYFPVQTRTYTFGQSVPAGLHKAGREISDYWKQLKMMIRPKTEAYKQVGSFIAIGNIFPGQWDWYSFWRVTGFLSIILAVMNILPIPALDGGHVLFLLWEMVTRRRPNDKFMERVQVVGMILLFALLIFAFGNDIYRFFIK